MLFTICDTTPRQRDSKWASTSEREKINIKTLWVYQVYLSSDPSRVLPQQRPQTEDFPSCVVDVAAHLWVSFKKDDLVVWKKYKRIRPLLSVFSEWKRVILCDVHRESVVAQKKSTKKLFWSVGFFRSMRTLRRQVSEQNKKFKSEKSLSIED